MQKRPRMSFPRPLSGIMKESFANVGLSERLRETEIWRIWKDVVGEAIAYRAFPLRIINGTLTVAVSSAPWIQELRFMTALMKEKLNAQLGSEVIREIVLKSGRVNLPCTEPPEIVPAIKILNVQQLANIEEQSKTITDTETRLAFIKLMQASLLNQVN